MQMKSQKTENNRTEISVIGAGIAGLTTAYHLGKKGYKVNLIDPILDSEINNLNPKNGTQASLGVLMGHVYKKSKGRAFLLRSKSMKLWKEWHADINFNNSSSIFKKPLIKLASSEKEYKSMQELIKNKQEYGIELLNKNSLVFWNNIFETKLLGGIISHEDGRLNPIELIKLFMLTLDQIKINKINQEVINIRKNNQIHKKKWNISLKNNQSINQDYIVICSALNTQQLLESLGHKIFLEPILGQVVEIELGSKIMNYKNWPGILNYQSINFIHDRPKHILIGATLEPGKTPSIIEKQAMLNMNNSAPKWIKQGKIIHEWKGIRARPKFEPAPILKELEDGLLINTGHYRNGILLAPACAEWIELKIEKNKY